jgi:hypothetical protein
VTDVHVPGSNWTLEVAPSKGWVPTWRPWVLAVVVIVSCLIGLLLAVILVSARLQTWLKVGTVAVNYLWLHDVPCVSSWFCVW